MSKIFGALREAIEKHDTIIIHRHKRPDPDAYGSAFGLKEMLKNSYPHKRIFAVGEDAFEFQYLGVTDKISDDEYENALVIVTDTANKERIDDSRYCLGNTLIKVDHHPNDDPYGTHVYVDTAVSSCSEYIYRFFEENKDVLTLNGKAARLLYAGIVGDTGRFMFSLYPNTLRIAGELLQYRFSVEELLLDMTTMPLHKVRFNGWLAQNFKFDNDVAYCIITKKICEEFQMNISEVSSLVNTLGMAKEAKAWALFVEHDTFIRVNLRSRGIHTVHQIAKKYRGGGHPKASGAMIRSIEDVPKILDELKAL